MGLWPDLGLRSYRYTQGSSYVLKLKLELLLITEHTNIVLEWLHWLEKDRIEQDRSLILSWLQSNTPVPPKLPQGSWEHCNCVWGGEGFESNAIPNFFLSKNVFDWFFTVTEVWGVLNRIYRAYHNPPLRPALVRWKPLLPGTAQSWRSHCCLPLSHPWPLKGKGQALL